MIDDNRASAMGQKPPVLSYQDLPDTANYKDIERFSKERLFFYPSRPLIDTLSTYCQGKNVLEVFAGRGALSSLLREQGISIIPTSLRSGHDGADVLGYFTDVEELSAINAVLKYRDWMDVLLVCWPTTSPEMERCLSLLTPSIPIIFIGEVTDYKQNPPFLGGCATDEFFEQVTEISAEHHGLSYPTMRCDTIKVFHPKVHD